jgi:hypothetical protein
MHHAEYIKIKCKFIFYRHGKIGEPKCMCFKATNENYTHQFVENHAHCYKSGFKCSSLNQIWKKNHQNSKANKIVLIIILVPGSLSPGTWPVDCLTWFTKYFISRRWSHALSTQLSTQLYHIIENHATTHWALHLDDASVNNKELYCVV